MRIGITCHATVGGSGAIAVALGKLLADQRHEVHFICHEMPFGLVGQRHPNITVHEVEVTQYPPLKYPPYGMALAVKMAAVTREAGLDLLHVHYAIPHALSGYLAREMLAPQRPKLVCTLHGTDVTLVGADPSYRPLVKFCIESCDAVTSVSNWLTETVKDSFETSRDVHTVYNFVDTNEYRRVETRPNELPRIVHISNFRPVKRTLDVVRVFKRVRERRKAHLLMVGDGPDRERAFEVAQSLGVAGDITFAGVTESVVEILSSADVFLLPSEMESFGLAALEAMACETPVVATRVGGLPEVVEDGATGYLLPLGDIESMASRTLEIIENPKLKRQLGERGRAVAREKFTPQAALRAYWEVYQSS
ncbi:MAG: N-acetyl-alpha-D-glucosaminyl L-malate synthase BshA [Candidatus Abyssubacteria bacterium]